MTLANHVCWGLVYVQWNSHSPSAPFDEFWQMYVALGPSPLGRPAAFPPAPSSPPAPLQSVIPLAWEPVTYFCHSMFAHSRILHAACHLLVPGFFHTMSILVLSLPRGSVCHWFIPLDYWAAVHCVALWLFVFSFTRGGTAGFFQSLGSKTKAAANIHVQGFVCPCLISLK